MRITFADVDRPKAVAKALARFSPDIKLATAHDAVANSCGYRSWYELSECVKLGKGITTRDLSFADVANVIIEIAGKLGLPVADVQYAVAKARLFSVPWSLSDNFKILTLIWRREIFGPHRRHSPGTVIRVKGPGQQTRDAYLVRPGDVTMIMYDTGPGLCADFEAVTPRTPLPDFVPARFWLPYGYWTLSDGTHVLFSRDYLPLWRVTPIRVEPISPWLWIDTISEHHHFSHDNGTTIWSTGLARKLALAHLAKHRITYLPRLVNIMPYFFGEGIEHVDKAVERYHEKEGDNAIIPLYARNRYHLAVHTG